jgi:hypothetical protein
LVKGSQPLDTYTATPLQVKPERDHLYVEYQTALSNRRAEMAGLQQENRRLYASHQETWGHHYETIRKIPMLRLHRQQLMMDFKKKKQAELTSIRQVMKQKQAEVRAKYPFTTWNQFLRHKAGQGQETALAILRSWRREFQNEGPVRMETASGHSFWNQKTLQVVEKMMAIWQKENGGLYQAQKLKYAIDAKGTVIFTLPSGGTIRDSGTEIHFSPWDKTAKTMALQLAQTRWELIVDMDGNRLKSRHIQEPAATLAKSEGYSR